MAGGLLVAVVEPEIHLGPVRERPRHDVAAVRAVPRRRDEGLIGPSDREHAGCRDAVCLVDARTRTLNHPGGHLALVVLDIQIPAHVRVRPLDSCQDADDRLRAVLVELRLTRMMPQDRDCCYEHRRSDKCETHQNTSLTVASYCRAGPLPARVPRGP